jgi:aspartyl-tRNA(Asn)/glutamyl-tRNA(Gln) amidotransferase subunit A
MPTHSVPGHTPGHNVQRMLTFRARLDLCAVAVPNGFAAGGLPNLAANHRRPYAEPLALRIGYAYQAAHNWHLKVPPMAA